MAADATREELSAVAAECRAQNAFARAVSREPGYKESRESQIPLGRWGKPKEVAQAILFLASTDATYVHGSNLVIDGGYVIH